MKRYSCLKASIGFIAAARLAGYNPNSNPTTNEIPTDNTTDHSAILGSKVKIVGGNNSGDTRTNTQRIAWKIGPHIRPTTTPSKPPPPVSTNVSTKNC